MYVGQVSGIGRLMWLKVLLVWSLYWYS